MFLGGSIKGDPPFLSIHPERTSGGTEVKNISFGVRLYVGLDPASPSLLRAAQRQASAPPFRGYSFRICGMGAAPTPKADREDRVSQHTPSAQPSAVIR